MVLCRRRPRGILGRVGDAEPHGLVPLVFKQRVCKRADNQAALRRESPGSDQVVRATPKRLEEGHFLPWALGLLGADMLKLDR